MFGIPLKIKIAVIAIGIGSALVYGGIQYHKHLQNTIAELQNQNLRLELAQESSTQVIDSLKSDQLEIVEINKQVTAEFNKITERVHELEDRLTKYDIGVLANAKPKLVEKAVNNGTADSNRCFEILSGVPLTEDEINATKKSESNTICPDVANPNYTPK